MPPFFFHDFSYRTYRCSVGRHVLVSGLICTSLSTTKVPHLCHAGYCKEKITSKLTFSHSTLMNMYCLLYMGYWSWPSLRSRWLDIDQVLSFCVFMGPDDIEVHKHAKKEWGQYPLISTKQAWSIKDLFYDFRGNYWCGMWRVILSGEDSFILPAQVANHSAGFDLTILRSASSSSSNFNWF